MITSVDHDNLIREFNRENAAEYWNGYFDFREIGVELHRITDELLRTAIEAARASDSRFIDSQQMIGEILTALGSQHNFHRQFHEQFPDYHPNQILGMQLYYLMVEDPDTWTYYEKHPIDHMYPHATYFTPPNR